MITVDARWLDLDARDDDALGRRWARGLVIASVHGTDTHVWAGVETGPDGRDPRAVVAESDALSDDQADDALRIGLMHALQDVARLLIDDAWRHELVEDAERSECYVRR